MSKLPASHDLFIQDTSGSPRMGFMLLKERGLRVYQLEDYRTIAPRVLSDAEFTQLQLPPEVEAVWFQENWQGGMGWSNHRIGLGQYGIAEGYKVDTASPSGIIQLARDTITSTVAGGNPSQYLPTGFATVGSEVWAFIGRDTYQWSYANTRFDYVSEPETISDSGYRNGIEYEGNTYVPHWLELDDPGNELPFHHIYKADADSGWTRSTLTPSAKYLAKADGKIWGAYIRDEADSTKDAITTATYKAKITGQATASTTLSSTGGINIGADANYVVIVAVMSSGSTDSRRIPTGVTVNGVACTSLLEQIDTNHGLSIWYILHANLTQGSHTVTATFTDAVDSAILHAASWYNIAQSSTFGAVAQATGTSTAPSVAATTTPKGFVFAAMLNTAVQAVTTSSPEVELSETSVSGASYIVQGWSGWEWAIASGTTSVTIAPTLAGSIYWRIAAVEVRGVTIDSDDTTIYLATDPTGSLAANDEIRLATAATPAANDELMKVTGITVSPPSIAVTRGYRGTTAAAHDGHFNIYKATYNVHHVRSATDLTNTGAWSAATTIGTSDAGITGVVAYVNENGTEFLLVLKSDGIWTLTAAGTLVELYSMKTQGDANNFREAFSWQGGERVLLPLGAGGMFELYHGVVRDISFSETMPDQAHLHGRVAAITADATRVFVLVQDTATSADRGTPGYHLMMGELVSISGNTDYRWHHVGEFAYTTGTRVTQNALMACGVPSGATVHHRVWIGFSSTGSDILPRFHTLVNDAQVQYVATDDAYFVTVRDDRGHPASNKRYSKVAFTTAGCTATVYWTMEYRVDGGTWTAITGTEATSRLNSNGSVALTFGSEVTGKYIELRGEAVQDATPTTTPQILDIRVTAQLRMDTIDMLPCQVYLGNHQRQLNGALEPLSVAARLSQLETWHDQAAEVTVVDSRGTSRSMVFLRGTWKMREVANRHGHEPEYVIGFVLAAV